MAVMRSRITSISATVALGRSAGLSGTFTDTRLTNGQTYRYKMRAVNGQGNSVETAEVSAIPRTVPDAPTITGTGGENEATVTITAPTNTGGLPILYYQYRVGSAGTWSDIPGGATVTSYTITGLDVSTHTIFVRAVTGIQAETERYASAASNGVSVIVTGPTISGPTAPRNLRVQNQFLISGNLWVQRFEWDAPTSLGVSGSTTPPTLVRYEYRISSDATWRSTGTTRSTGNFIRIDNASTTTPYVEVRAINNNDAPNHLGAIARYTYENGRWTETSAVVAPVIAAIDNESRIDGYSQFTIQARLSSGSTPTWSISGIAGATISQSGLITIPAGLSVATHTATVTATNTAGSDTEQFSVVVAAVGSAIAPVIAAISNVPRTSGYAQFTIQASLSSGTTPTWSISGIEGATISRSGLITIPAGLSIATHTATVTATNAAGSDTEQFSVVVAGVAANIRDGSVTRIGSASQFGVGERSGSFIAIAPNGTVYMVGVRLRRLYTLNLTTGVATRVGTGTLDVPPAGFTIASNGTAYMVGGFFGGTQALYTINLSTGATSQVGSATNFGVNQRTPRGLAIAADGTAYMISNTNLYTLNLTTGVATRVGSATNFGLSRADAYGLAIAGDGTAYMLDSATDAIYTLNLTTGVATRVGSATQFGVFETDPRGLAIAADGTAYMTGSRLDALFRFNGA